MDNDVIETRYGKLTFWVSSDGSACFHTEAVNVASAVRVTMDGVRYSVSLGLAKEGDHWKLKREPTIQKAVYVANAGKVSKRVVNRIVEAVIDGWTAFERAYPDVVAKKQVESLQEDIDRLKQDRFKARQEIISLEERIAEIDERITGVNCKIDEIGRGMR